MAEEMASMITAVIVENLKAANEKYAGLTQEEYDLGG